MMNLSTVLGVAKGLAVLLALFTAYNLGKDSVKLDVATEQVEKHEKNEKAYRNVYSKSDASVLDGLRKYKRGQ